jgi:HEPN domain-containing protein
MAALAKYLLGWRQDARMSVEGQNLYPGEAAAPEQILLLANEYRLAAELLITAGRRGEPLSRSPYRLVAIHAIELYLNAFLLASGHSPSKLRGLHHNLSLRTELALNAKLSLRKLTLIHLQALSETREYLVTRYDPVAAQSSELNRLAATLAEIACKVAGYLASRK